MALSPPSNEVLQSVRAEFGLDENGISEAVQDVKNWLKLQPHLPHECDDARLERWIIRCKNSLERVKSSIDMYYTLKTAASELMIDRDPCADWFKRAATVGYGFPLPTLTEDYCRVTICGLLDPDLDKVNPLDILKGTLMVHDVRLCEDYFSSEITVVDFQNFSLGHVTKVTLPLLKKFEAFVMKAFKYRIKSIHLLNLPPYADVLLSLMKKVLSDKVASRIYVHSNGYTSLHEHISTKILPHEYGGENGRITDHWSVWLKKMESYRDWFQEQDKYKADESKRPGKAFDSGELFGFEGSFRQMNVD